MSIAYKAEKIIRSLFPKRLVKFMHHLYLRGTSFTHIRDLRDIILLGQTHDLQRAHPNPLNRYGKKCFSQSDEDGITLEILSRIGCVNEGTFIEFGVGDGTENNTLILKALGWRGVWVGGEDLAFQVSPNNKDFKYYKDWITLDNILSITNSGKKFLDVDKIDLISLDLDGNDIYLVEELLNNRYLPKLFIVEYNSKFMPPIRWKINYNPTHEWERDDYFGASLSSYVDLFANYGYRLICCNSHTGANAFFIKNEYANDFSDIPVEINDIYVGPRYYLYKSYGHKPSIKTIENLFN